MQLSRLDDRPIWWLYNSDLATHVCIENQACALRYCAASSATLPWAKVDTDVGGMYINIYPESFPYWNSVHQRWEKVTSIVLPHVTPHYPCQNVSTTSSPYTSSSSTSSFTTSSSSSPLTSSSSTSSSATSSSSTPSSATLSSQHHGPQHVQPHPHHHHHHDHHHHHHHHHHPHHHILSSHSPTLFGVSCRNIFTWYWSVFFIFPFLLIVFVLFLHWTIPHVLIIVFIQVSQQPFSLGICIIWLAKSIKKPWIWNGKCFHPNGNACRCAFLNYLPQT